MSVVNTTNVIDNSMFLKAELAPNMVGDNYYIENLQDKRDQDWEYRYNRVWIEEELDKQVVYSNSDPVYTPIDVVITDVKGEKGQSLGTDWASLAFRDLEHSNKIGDRYRFTLDFPDMRQMTEEEKKYNTSVWLSVNRAPIHPGNSCLVRRCNTTLTLLGYENRDRRKTSTREVHLEPVVLENEQMKYMQVYYNQTTPVPQAEWYAIAQLNYYTNNIKINDRFIFGTLDDEVRENNATYKVKAVIKANNSKTFVKQNDNGSDELSTTPLIILALDKDAVAPQDNFKTRIANNAPVYLIPTASDKSEKAVPKDDSKEESKGDSKKKEETKSDVYVLQDIAPVSLSIPLGQSQTYKLKLLCNDIEVNNPIVNYSVKLAKKQESDWAKYFRIEYLNNEMGFTITNLKTWLGGKLEVSVTCNIPNSDETISKKYSITLDKSY